MGWWWWGLLGVRERWRIGPRGEGDVGECLSCKAVSFTSADDVRPAGALYEWKFRPMQWFGWFKTDLILSEEGWGGWAYKFY